MKGPCQNTPFDAISIFLREQETARSLHLHNLMKWSMNKFLLNEPYCTDAVCREICWSN